MKSFKTYAVVTLLLVVIIVVFQNTETVETKLLFATLAMPRALLLFLTLLTGVIIGLVLATRFPRGEKGET